MQYFHYAPIAVHQVDQIQKILSGSLFEDVSGNVKGVSGLPSLSSSRFEVVRIKTIKMDLFKVLSLRKALN